MGYRGRIADRERAQDLRADAWTLQQIADELRACRGQVSAWVRDVEFTPKPRSRARKRGPNKLERAKLAEIEQLKVEGRQRIGQLSQREFLVAGVALYAGEGAKGDGRITFANSDPRMMRFFITWLRTFFAVDESRLRFTLYLHAGLDLDAANVFWSNLTEIPLSQFGKPYRAIPDPSIRHSKHPMGCPRVGYSCSRSHRALMGLVDGLLSSTCFPG